MVTEDENEKWQNLFLTTLKQYKRFCPLIQAININKTALYRQYSCHIGN